MASFGTRFKQLAPHYIAIVALILMVVWTADLFFDVSRPVRFGLALIVAVAYPFVLRALGAAPEPWA